MKKFQLLLTKVIFRSGSSFMSQNNFLAEEQSSPEDCEYLYSDEEARREAEAYADMD